METMAHAAATSTGERVRDSLLRRKYVIPFLLACVILACNTATGINSVIQYNTGILLQSGMSDLLAHWGYVIFTAVNFLATTIAWCWWTARAQIPAGDGHMRVIVPWRAWGYCLEPRKNSALIAATRCRRSSGRARN